MSLSNTCRWAVVAFAFSQVTLANDKVIHAGHLIDGMAKSPRDHVSILIHDDRITGIQDGFVTPSGAEVIDLSTATVLPGLIDCHDHITMQADGGNPVAERVTRAPLDEALRATLYARRTLAAGFTTIRNVSAFGGTDFALKRAINNGFVVGPRMWVSGQAISPSGGHGDPSNGLDPDLERPHWTDAVVDSPFEGRKAVRLLRKDGADLIKIMPSGGVLSIGDNPEQQLMDDDEIAAIVQEAHALGMKVAGSDFVGGGHRVRDSAHASGATAAVVRRQGTAGMRTLLRMDRTRASLP